MIEIKYKELWTKLQSGNILNVKKNDGKELLQITKSRSLNRHNKNKRINIGSEEKLPIATYEIKKTPGEKKNRKIPSEWNTGILIIQGTKQTTEPFVLHI